MMKKSVGLFFVSLMLVGVFAYIVGAQDSRPASQPSSGSIADKIFGGAGSAISDLLKGFTTEGFQKVLMLFLVVLILYSVLGYLPFFENKNDVLPGPAKLPFFFERILRISAVVRFLLSDNPSIKSATPPGP